MNERKSAAGSWRPAAKWASAVVAAVLALGTAACSPSSGSGGGGGGEAGDTLRYGVIGGANDTNSPYNPSGGDGVYSLGAQLYEGLTTLDNEGNVEMALAESMEPNDSLDVWTVHLREGVKKHDGEDFNADDVLSSIEAITDPDAAYGPASQIDMVDPEQIVKVDELTLEFHLTRPYGPFPAAWSSHRLVMRGADWTSENPIGTGMFVQDSFTPGQQAKLHRFEDYWGEQPKLDNLEITYFKDQAALVNAVRGGQVDIANSAPFAEVATLKSVPGLEVLESDSVAHPTLDMRTDLPPFDDPRVREAMRLVVDREQMVENGYSGFATAASDFNGINTACPAPDVPDRERDIERAKELLAEAGQENLEIELTTDAGRAGMRELAELYAQQAADAGITVNVKILDMATFLNNWLQWPFYVGWIADPYLTMAKRQLLPGGENNGSHFDDPEFNELAEKLYATADEAEQCELVTQMMEIEYERGGGIVPIYAKSVTVHRDTVDGLEPDRFGRAAYRFGGVSVEK